MLNIFYILFGLSLNFKISFFGDLYFSQIFILLLSIIFFLNLFGKNLLYGYEKTILFLIFLWLVSQIFSDVINEIDFVDYARGNSKIIVTFLSFYVFFKLSKIEKFSLIKMLLWVSLVKIIFLLLLKANNYNEFVNSWKFGLGLSFSIAVIIMSYLYLYKEKNRLHELALLSIILMGFASLIFEARFLFLFNLLFAGYLVLNNRFKIQNNFTLILSTAFMVYFVSTLYQFLIDINFLPQHLYLKQLKQSSGQLGLLLGGRAEFFSSFKAIFDAPIFGHGSWAKNCDYVDYKSDVLFNLGYNPKRVISSTCLIPTHSVILGSWVTAGFFGFLTWFYLLLNIIKKTVTAIKFKNNYYELALYLLILCIWDIIFSPYGGTRMILLPLYIVIIFSISSNYKQNF